MDLDQAKALVETAGLKVVIEHSFAGGRGIILRLDNGAMINCFYDGRYYVQGENTVEIMAAFAEVEPPWDPETG